MTALATLLETVDPHTHLVQLYGDGDATLVRNVGQYAAEGLRRGEGVLLLANPRHREEFLGELRSRDAGVDQALDQGRLICLDAVATLDTFMRDGQPDWPLFEESVGGCLRDLQTRVPSRQVRAYGEMVGLLWEAGRRDAAARLEQHWNRLLQAFPLRLFCAYPIDIFGRDFQIATVDAILCEHTHLLPSDPAVERALQRALDEVLGPKLEGLRALIKPNYRPSWAVIPPPEATILWLRNNVSVLADEILARAGRYYRRSHLALHPTTQATDPTGD